MISIVTGAVTGCKRSELRSLLTRNGREPDRMSQTEYDGYAVSSPIGLNSTQPTALTTPNG